jgi:hypothetical protein
MVRKTFHGIETCQDCMDIWIFVGMAESIRFNALLKVCRERLDPKYSAPRLQRHLEGMVGTFLTRTKRRPQVVTYSLVDSDGFPKHLNASISVEGRNLSLYEIVQLLVSHFESTLYSELEIIIKGFLKETTPSEEARGAIARKQGQLLVAICKDAMAGRPESEYREVLNALKTRAKTRMSIPLSLKKDNQGSP